VAGLLLSCVLLSTLVIACGTADEPEPGSATARMKQILGRAPKGAAAAIAARGELLIAVTPDYPPLSYYNDDGELTGFDVEVGKAVAEYLQLGPRFTEPVWEAVPAGLANDRFDVSIGSLSPDQGLVGPIAYSEPYYYTEGLLLVRAGAPQLKGVEALAGKRVGAGIHTVFYRWLQEQEDTEVVAYPSDAEALAGLEAGRVDAILLSGLAARQAIDAGRGVERSGPPLLAEPMAFVVGKDEEDLRRVMDAAIAALREDGVLTELSQQWFGGQDLSRSRAAANTSASPASASP